MRSAAVRSIPLAEAVGVQDSARKRESPQKIIPESQIVGDRMRKKTYQSKALAALQTANEEELLLVAAGKLRLPKESVELEQLLSAPSGRTRRDRAVTSALLEERAQSDDALRILGPCTIRWKGERMCTRCTIKYERDEATGQEIHLFEDLLDDPDCVLLEVEGFTFESSISVAPSGKLETRAMLRIPKRWARILGLIGESPEKSPRNPALKKRNIGSTFDSWLRKEGSYEKATANAIKPVATRKMASPAPRTGPTKSKTRKPDKKQG